MIYYTCNHYIFKLESIKQFLMEWQMDNLVYTCVFYDSDFILLLDILLQSISRNCKTICTFDVLIFTEPSFKTKVEKLIECLNFKVHICILECNSIVEAKSTRLKIFDWPFIYKYKHILYLDTDIVIGGNISDIFNHRLDDLLYAQKEGPIESQYLGGKLFDFNIIDKNTQGFNSGVLLFPNSMTIKFLFMDIYKHIVDYNKQYPLIGYVDQQFINYHTIPKKLHNMDLLSKYCTNSPSLQVRMFNHFAGSHGNIINKYKYMKEYFKKML